MNKVRCIVCDIDYTLAVKGGMLMPLTKKSLTVAHERGIKIGLASGREIDRKLINQDVVWDLDFKFDFIIGMNGGQVRDIENNNIDISHFTGQAHTKNIGKYKTPIEDYLTNKVKITSHKLRLRLLKEGIFEYKCACCGNSEWLGQPIPLELHHKDGNKDNNNLDNLELRCPNCHYFTETYKTKNWST